MTDDRVQDPWRWPEAIWRGIVRKVSAGRSLASAWRPGRARSAVALSFDSDHETIELRNGGSSFGRMSQGQYGDDVPTGVVELPVEWIRDDAVYFNMDRGGSLRPYTSPEAVLSIFAREFDVAHEEGGLFLLTMHPHHSGHRSRIFILDEIIRIAKAKGDVWFAMHAEVARLCAEQAGLPAHASNARHGSPLC